MPDFKITCDDSNAFRLAEWVRSCGGVAEWTSISLSNPGAAWLTPANAEQKPNWQSANQPAQIVTDPQEIGVITYREVRRFHIAVRRSSNGMSLKLTDASSNKVRLAVNKAGEGATYWLDHWTQQAVIVVPDKTISLATWMRRAGADTGQ